jgi:phosphoribosylglycinamide formyltransferase-1
METKMQLAMLISGGGTTMKQILLAIQAGYLPRVNPALIIASSYEAGGIGQALKNGFEMKNIAVIKPRKNPAESQIFGEEILSACHLHGVDFIGQFGWLPLTPENVIDAYRGRIINQHPGPLDPGGIGDFGGPGMYGRRVHCARLAFVRWTAPRALKPGVAGYDEHFCTEVTSHHVTKEFDQGPIIGRTVVPIFPDDDVDMLQKRALPYEHKLQIDMLKAISKGNMPSFIRKKSLVDYNHLEELSDAKRFARTIFPKG